MIAELKAGDVPATSIASFGLLFDPSQFQESLKYIANKIDSSSVFLDPSQFQGFLPNHEPLWGSPWSPPTHSLRTEPNKSQRSKLRRLRLHKGLRGAWRPIPGLRRSIDAAARRGVRSEPARREPDSGLATHRRSGKKPNQIDRRLAFWRFSPRKTWRKHKSSAG